MVDNNNEIEVLALTDEDGSVVEFEFIGTGGILSVFKHLFRPVPRCPRHNKGKFFPQLVRQKLKGFEQIQMIFSRVFNA